MIAARAVLLALTVCAGACAMSADSTAIKTSAIYATYTISQSDQELPRAIATLHVRDPSGTPLRVADPDILTCDGMQLTESAAGLDTAYEVGVAAAPSHAFVFARPHEAPFAATVAAPVDFTLTSPPLEGTYDGEYTLAWAGGVDSTVSISATSTTTGCVRTVITTDAIDQGTFAFSGVAFRTANGGTPDCVYSIDLARDVTSPNGPPFAGGALISRRVRTTTIHVHP